MSKHVPPSIDAVSFSCPHCGAFTSQVWYDVLAVAKKGGETPFFPTPEIVAQIKKSEDCDDETRKNWLDWAEKTGTGEVFLAKKSRDPYARDLNNVWVSECFACRRLAIWKHKSLLFPASSVKFDPNPDLPEDIKRDFREAESILMLSPRGTAALLRLAIQKLCTHLGGPEKTIDQNIAWLVGQGLDVHVQQALDAVRVVGNEAVHPGELDLSDDIEAASSLFGLVNIIAEEMISRKKRVQSAYDMLPEAKRKAIEARNTQALAKAKSGD